MATHPATNNKQNAAYAFLVKGVDRSIDQGNSSAPPLRAGISNARSLDEVGELADEVVKWLEKNSLGKHSEVMMGDTIGIARLQDLMDLSEEDVDCIIKELGLNIGERKRLTRGIAELRAGGVPAAKSPDAAEEATMVPAQVTKGGEAIDMTVSSLEVDYGMNWRQSEFSHFCKALATNTMIGMLSLTDNGLGDDECKELSKALKMNTTLTEMDLYGNLIGDIGVTALSEALKVNASIQGINLSLNQIGDAGASALAEALKTNKTINQITLGMNPGFNRAKITDDRIWKNYYCYE